MTRYDNEIKHSLDMSMTADTYIPGWW